MASGGQMNDEINPDCSHTTSVFGHNHHNSNQQFKPPAEEYYINIQKSNSEHGLYPTNTFAPPTHTPGRHSNKGSHEAPPLYTPPVIDFTQYDIVKASQYGYLDRVKQLVEEEGVDVRKPDAENVTLLHWAAINNRQELVPYFLSKGALVDQTGGTLNATPLHWAIRQGLLDMVILLMRYGADPVVQDNEGCCGLHLAAQFGHSPIVAYLISKGTDVDIPDRNGMTPLMWAAYRSFGVDPLRLILNFGASINYCDSIHRNTALHWAITSSNTNGMAPLLKAGASLEAINGHGESVFQLASARKNKYMSSQLEKEKTRRGIGRPSFIRTINTDPVARRQFTAAFPFIPLFSVGIILEYSPWWVYTIFMLTIVFGFMQVFMRLFYDPHNNSIAVGLYLATKSYMFLSLFLYFWPLIDEMKLHVMFWTNATLLTYFFWKCWQSDPGFIKVSPSQQKKQIIELAESKMLNDFTKFCTTCLARRPIRSKHCAICDKCVARMDHHCPWIDNCVGYRNHGHFVGFLFCLFFVNLWYIWATIRYFNYFCGPFNEGILIDAIKAMSCAPWVSWGFCMASFHSFWVGALFTCNLYQVLWLGMTTNERMNASRYKHFQNKGGIKSPFSSGVIQNAADFFNFSFFGLVRPRKIDWMNEFDTRDIHGPQNWRQYQNI